MGCLRFLYSEIKDKVVGPMLPEAKIIRTTFLYFRDIGDVRDFSDEPITQETGRRIRSTLSIGIIRGI